MTIEVLICTIGKGIIKTVNVLAEPRDDVKYLVSFQYTNYSDLNLIPDGLKKRSDVSLFPVYGSGLSANRNYAMRHSVGDIILFADDDNRYTWECFDRLLDVFRKNPNADAICFRSVSYKGCFQRKFPDCSFELNSPPKGYYVRSCEIVLRQNKNYPEFDTHFGLGSEYLACGEEEVFVYDLIKKGYKVIYCPVTIVSTASSTTGALFLKLASVRRSKGAVLSAIHGYWGALPRIIKYAIFNVKGMPRLKALSDMLCGAAYAKRTGRC